VKAYKNKIIMNKTLYVVNGGDGSANIILCESKELAEYLDNNQYQGYAESSTIDLASMEIETKESVFYEKLQDDDSDVIDFYNQFNPSLELNDFKFVNKYAHFNLGVSPLNLFNYKDLITEEGTQQMLDNFKLTLNGNK
jgi:hypothetical protein